ncbi:MAG: phage tail tape measure protein [Ruminococcus sp.]|nr:phage tail tape measure protein [Ruminococcus sp.]
MAFDGTLKFDTAIDKTGFKLGIDNLGNIAKSGMSLITGAIGAASGAVTALGGYAVKVGKEFESGMSQIGATLGYSVAELHDETSVAHENMEKLTAKAEEMGRKTAFSASQAAEGLNILAMSGYDASTSIDMVENVLNLAAAGGLSLAQSASYVSGSMKGFVAEAMNFADATEASAYYSDMIAKGATLANTNVSQLGEALSQASAAANSYGQASATTEVALLRLAEQNVTGTAAATALSAAMKNIYSPMDKAKEVMDELGVSAYNSAGEARDFNQVVNELNDALSTKTAQERASLEDAIFGIQGKDAFDKMVSTSAEKTQEFYNSLEYTDNGSMGSAALQAETMLDNLEGRITLFQSASEGFANAIYKHLQDPLKELVEIGTDYVSELTESLESGDFSGLAESLGSVLADAVTTLSGYIPSVVEMGASLIQSLVSGLSDNAPQILESLIPALKSLVSGILIISEDLIQLGGELILMLGSGIAQALPDIADTAISLIFTLVDTLSELIPELIPIAAEIIQTLADSLAENIPVFTEKLTELTSEIIKSFTSSDFLMTILNLGILIIQSLTDGVISAIPVIIEAVPAIIENIMDFVMEALPALIDAGAELISMLIVGIT